MSVLTLVGWLQWDCKLGFKEPNIQSQNCTEINSLEINSYSVTIWCWWTYLEENANPLEKNSYWLHTRRWHIKVSLFNFCVIHRLLMSCKVQRCTCQEKKKKTDSKMLSSPYGKAKCNLSHHFVTPCSLLLYKKLKTSFLPQQQQGHFN